MSTQTTDTIHCVSVSLPVLLFPMLYRISHLHKQLTQFIASQSVYWSCCSLCCTVSHQHKHLPLTAVYKAVDHCCCCSLCCTVSCQHKHLPLTAVYKAAGHCCCRSLCGLKHHISISQWNDWLCVGQSTTIVLHRATMPHQHKWLKQLIVCQSVHRCCSPNSHYVTSMYMTETISVCQSVHHCCCSLRWPKCHVDVKTARKRTQPFQHNYWSCFFGAGHKHQDSSHYLAFLGGGGMSCRSLCPEWCSCAGGCQRAWLMVWNRTSLVTGCWMLAHTPAWEAPNR